ncbi:hypothetical protein V1527DRAFT_467225 [Lipomyces starkeyi]
MHLTFMIILEYNSVRTTRALIFMSSSSTTKIVLQIVIGVVPSVECDFATNGGDKTVYWQFKQLVAGACPCSEEFICGSILVGSFLHRPPYWPLSRA